MTEIFGFVFDEPIGDSCLQINMFIMTFFSILPSFKKVPQFFIFILVVSFNPIN